MTKQLYAITLKSGEIILAKTTAELVKSIDGRPAITLQAPLLLVPTEKGFSFAAFSPCAEYATIYTENLYMEPQLTRPEFASAYQKATSSLIIPDTAVVPASKLVL